MSQCSLWHLHIVLILNKIVTAYVIYQKGILCRWLNYQYVNDASFHLQRVHHYHLAAQQAIYKTDHDYFAFFFGLIHRELFFLGVISKMNSTKSTGTLAWWFSHDLELRLHAPLKIKINKNFTSWKLLFCSPRIANLTSRIELNCHVSYWQYFNTAQ